MLFGRTSVPRDSPGFYIAGKLVIIVLRSGDDLDLNTKKMNATVCLRRCLFLYGAWLSHNTYDARMVNMALGIVNHDMSDLTVNEMIILTAAAKAVACT